MRLEAGEPSSESVIVHARKAHLTFRPVPVLGIAERIAVSALTEYVLRGEAEPARSSDDYRQFLYGPIGYEAMAQQTMRPWRSATPYVVESDIASFYEYVDHSILLDELRIRTDEVEGSGALVNLLAEIQGKVFGLPQLIDASDRLSELYIQRVEREVVRRGLTLWRYNDDFKTVAHSFASALAAVESIDIAAHSNGLTLNESKTRVNRFDTYFWRHILMNPSAEGDVEFTIDDLKGPILTDYEQQGEEMHEEAVKAISPLIEASRDRDYDVYRNIDGERAKSVRAALRVLGREGDDSAKAIAADVFEYLPHLSHRVTTYLEDLHREGASDVEPTWLAISGRHTNFNEWQRVWLTYLARVLGTGQSSALDWLSAQHATARTPLLHAETALALAPHGRVDYSALDEALRVRPAALSAWYVLAVSRLPHVPDAKLSALRGSNRQFRLLLEASRNSD